MSEGTIKLEQRYCDGGHLAACGGKLLLEVVHGGALIGAFLAEFGGEDVHHAVESSR